jgi:hypothetical protein
MLVWRAPGGVSAPARQCHMAGHARKTRPSHATLAKTRKTDGMTGRGGATYGSVSESSVSRLLATLLCRPSESSLWLRGSALGRLTCGTGGMSFAGSSWARSSWLVADLVRLLRPLNILDMRRRWCDDVSLRPPSEPRLRILSSVPSDDLGRSSSRLSLLATETADDSGLFDVARLAGAARLSLLATSGGGMALLARSTAAMLDHGRAAYTARRCEMRDAIVYVVEEGRVHAHMLSSRLNARVVVALVRGGEQWSLDGYVGQRRALQDVPDRRMRGECVGASAGVSAIISTAHKRQDKVDLKLKTLRQPARSRAIQLGLGLHQAQPALFVAGPQAVASGS